MENCRSDTRVRTRVITPGSGDEFFRIAHMFAPYRENALMRELCRLAVKCARGQAKAKEGSARV